MQTIGSALGDELSVTEIRDGLSKPLLSVRAMRPLCSYISSASWGPSGPFPLDSYNLRVARIFYRLDRGCVAAEACSRNSLSAACFCVSVRLA